MNTEELGVVTLGATFEAVKVNVRVTDLERTLIDLVVRPAYAGGPDEVLNAFRIAKNRASPERIAELLKRLNYTYPFHQAIGLYMDAAGYPEADLALFKKKRMQFDFYLAPQMSSKKFVDQWRIHVPDSVFQSYTNSVGKE
jgi:predicted transcriptional regulator of viral defense system